MCRHRASVVQQAISGELPDVQLPAAAPFEDVSSAHPFYREMAWMAEPGISKGWATAGKNKEYRPTPPWTTT